MSKSYDTLAMNILSLLLHEPRNFKDGRLCSEMFPSPLDSVFNIAIALYREGCRPTAESIGTFKHKDAGEASKIAAQILGRSAPVVPFERLIQTAATHLAKLRVAAVCRKYHELAHDAEADFSEIISAFQGDALAIKIMEPQGGLQEGSNFKTINERIQWKQKNIGKLRGPSTGYVGLDRLIDGLNPRFYIIGARPSVGKTSVLCDINSSICSSGGRTIFFSLEMQADDIRERTLSSHSRVALSGFRDTIYTISELEAVTKAQNEMQKWKWWINDNPNTTISDIESQVMSLYREVGKIDMIGVDYIQIVNVINSKNRDRRHEIDEISRRLKALGKSVNAPMIALSQLSRQEGIYDKQLGRTLEKRPELSSLKESGGLEADADAALLIHRDIRHEPEKAEFILGKNRGGPTGDIKMKYNPQLTTFSDEQ